MTDISLILAGYFAKKVDPLPASFPAAPVVKEICSVSTCISPGPTGWIDRWLHNDLFLYDTERVARSVIPDEEVSSYTLFAYKLLPIRFTQTDAERLSLPPVTVSPLADSYVRLGFDVVEGFRHEMGIFGYGCSPLSCNGLASEWPVNRYCLVDDLDTACCMARAFARPNAAEPGPYVVMEVWRANKSQVAATAIPTSSAPGHR